MGVIVVLVYPLLDEKSALCGLDKEKQTDGPEAAKPPDARYGVVCRFSGFYDNIR